MTRVEPKVGQVWLDQDARPPGRKLLVIKLTETHVICSTAYEDGRPHRNRRTAIRRDRLRPKGTSGGYTLVSDL